MTAIHCQDTVFLTTDFDACVNELQANQATIRAPIHVIVRPTGLRIGVPEIRLHDLVVDFDETRTGRAAVLAVLAKYGSRERQPDPGASLVGAVAVNPSPIFVAAVQPAV